MGEWNLGERLAVAEEILGGHAGIGPARRVACREPRALCTRLDAAAPPLAMSQVWQAAVLSTVLSLYLQAPALASRAMRFVIRRVLY